MAERYKGRMKGNGKETGPTSKAETYGREKGIQDQCDPEKELEENIRKCVPEDARKAMADMTFEQKQALFIDIFKPLDFYELLFEKCFTKKPVKSATNIDLNFA